MAKLKEEYERVEAQNYELNFVYPPEEVRKKLKVVNRDRSALEQKNIKGAASNLNRLISDIGAGRVLLEDLPADDIAVLKQLLDNGAHGRDPG